jgi:hypothetical protein
MQAPDWTSRSPSLVCVSFLLLAASCTEGAISDAAVGKTSDSQTSDAGTKPPAMSQATGSGGSRQLGDEGSPPEANPSENGKDAFAAPDGATLPADAGTGDSTTSTGVWRPFSDASPWNAPIAAGATVAPDSDALIADFAASSQWPYLSINIDNYSIPVYRVDSSTPLATMQATIIGGEGFENGRATLPIPPGAVVAQGTDRHLCIVDRQSQKEWGFWDTNKTGSAAWTCSVGAAADLGGTGVRPPKDGRPSWRMSVGARACGFALSAGLITVDEIRAGRIEHALVIAYPHIRSHFFVSPASTAQGTTDKAISTRGIPCGGRVQLDPTLDVDNLGLSRSGLIIARALQEYGAFVGDFSGAMSLYADASPDALAVWHGGVLSMLEVKDKIDLRKFRVLELGQRYEDDN